MCISGFIEHVDDNYESNDTFFFLQDVVSCEPCACGELFSGLVCGLYKPSELGIRWGHLDGPQGFGCLADAADAWYVCMVCMHG
jgi:hypothetical protein